MAPCTLCNDLETGEGDLLPCQTWISSITSSSCLYCRIVVKSLEKLEPNYLSQSYLNLQGTNVQCILRILQQGQLYVDLFTKDTAIRTCFFELFRLAQDELQSDMGTFSQIPVRGEVSPLPGDRPMWAFLRSSLRKCIEEHSACRESQDSGWRPQRLLFIQESDGKYWVQLIDTQDHCPVSGYAALSHCWGSEPLACTTSENIQIHQEAIALASLPRTFQDAITVAIKMDVAYIWIDSLCIIQGDKNDWAGHAEKMDKIYENALIVVAATSSNAGSIPFLGSDADTDRYIYRTVDIDIKVDMETQEYCEVAITLKARNFDSGLSPMCIRGPLEDRAWACQESYCAVRLIRFTDTEVKWRCNTAAGCECHGALTMDVSKPLQLSDNKGTIFEQWRQVTIEFAGRNLTYGTDRLPALAGIASRFHTRLESQYLAGLWREELPLNLKWYRDERDFDQASLVSPAMNNGVPSWSWASNHGKCRWLWKNYLGPDDSELKLQSFVDVVQIDCLPSAANAFGEVQAGSSIELRGRVVQVVMECDDLGRASVAKPGFNAQVMFMDCRTSPATDDDDRNQCGLMRRDVTQPPTDIQFSSGVLPETRPSTRYRGSALCLLLCSAPDQGHTQICTLVLGEIRVGNKVCYQRLGIGCGRLRFWSGPIYKDRRDGGLWRGWEDLEEWTDWENFFAEAETRTLRIV